MKKINLKSANLKEMLSKDEMKKVVGGTTWCPIIQYNCNDNGLKYSSYEECDANCVQACSWIYAGVYECSNNR